MPISENSETQPQSDKSGDATDGGGVVNPEVGVTNKEPVSQLRRRPQGPPGTEGQQARPHPPMNSSGEPPGGFSLFLIVLLLLCVLVLVARRVVIMCVY